MQSHISPGSKLAPQFVHNLNNESTLSSFGLDGVQAILESAHLIVSVYDAKHLLLIVEDGIAGRLDTNSCHDLASGNISYYVNHFCTS